MARQLVRPNMRVIATSWYLSVLFLSVIVVSRLDLVRMSGSDTFQLTVGTMGTFFFAGIGIYFIVEHFRGRARHILESSVLADVYTFFAGLATLGVVLLFMK